MSDRAISNECRWQEFYCAAILETDSTKLTERIVRAEWAIILRRYTLLSQPEVAFRERRELDAALDALQMLKAAA